MDDMQQQGNWERDVFKQLAHDYLKEKRRKRRWGIFFKLSFLAIFAFIIYFSYFGKDVSADKQRKYHTALIDISGAIFEFSEANADNITKALRGAFKDKYTQAIIIRINSPGGSPVQADYIYNELRRLRAQKPNIKVYAVCTDMCASAAYYIAAAADEIYANPASLVGSIGVLYNGFGFVGAMQKLGVERRLVTAGKNKGFMDPFSPQTTAETENMQAMLDSVHKLFIKSVIQGRGNRLKRDPDIFSGLVWTGSEAKPLGLIDAFGSAGYVAREVIKNENIVDYTVKETYFERVAKKFGGYFAHEMAQALGVYGGRLS